MVSLVSNKFNAHVYSSNDHMYITTQMTKMAICKNEKLAIIYEWKWERYEEKLEEKFNCGEDSETYNNSNINQYCICT